jgi:D-xylose transport system substrate-binding protein
MIQMVRKGAVVVSASLALCLAAAACSSSSSTSASTSTSTSTSASASSSASGVSVSISVAQFDRTLSAMSVLKPLTAAGKGNVAVILPDTVSSARYTEFDAPYLTQALTMAGLSSSQFSVQNAQGSDATELSDAQTAITKGASVLIMDPLDSGVGAQIESLAKSKGVAVIDYDRLTLGGSRTYYVSFNNVLVGTKIGQGFTACAAAWHVAKPNVLVMKGAPTDNNATLFAQGYDAVLAPFFSSGKYVQVGSAAGTWDPPTALSEFQQQFTAHPNINSVVTPNDENAAPIIHYLQTKGVKAKTFPVTGQDATTVGLQNILAGYQCGTVYKPIYLEAQAAVALAIFQRAGKTPPASLVNGATQDSKANVSVPSVLLQPTWVTTTNMASTVIADKFVTVAQLCVGQYVALCKTAGISL